MSTTKEIAKLFRNTYFGGNWTAVDYKSTLANVTWQQAITKVHSFNTIAILIFHTHYYVSEVAKFLQGEPLKSSDKYSFDLPPIQSQEDWDNLLRKVWDDAEKFAVLIENLPEHTLWETFVDDKYGNYYRNLHGIIEHCHYHLGQIVLIKKILQEGGTD